MPSDTDDYVISLLKKDADLNQARYLQNGLGSLLAKRPKSNARKPNTRFLRNIIRDTDNHNAALKAREEEESQARLRDLQREQSRGKRRREDEVDEGLSKRRREDDRPGRWANVLGGLGKRPERRSDRRQDEGAEGEAQSKRHEATRRGRSKDNDSSRTHRERKGDRSNRSYPRDLNRDNRRRARPRPRSGSPRADNDQNPVRETQDQMSDSDSRDDTIGPKPPPKDRPRGRGALKSSDMDARFDPSYNPRTDVNLEPEEDPDDWDMALEAVRDRAKWRANGADRLLAAGFTGDEVRRWEKGSDKDVEDVRWRKNGESREWDRGKVVGVDGSVELKADWAQPKAS